MPIDSGTTIKKEATILSLSQDIHKLLADFQVRLDDYFARSKPEGESSKKPENPNVLDEIIEELEIDKAWLNGIMVFVSTEVLPKIN